MACLSMADIAEDERSMHQKQLSSVRIPCRASIQAQVNPKTTAGENCFRYPQGLHPASEREHASFSREHSRRCMCCGVRALVSIGHASGRRTGAVGQTNRCGASECGRCLKASMEPYLKVRVGRIVAPARMRAAPTANVSLHHVGSHVQ